MLRSPRDRRGLSERQIDCGVEWRKTRCRSSHRRARGIEIFAETTWPVGSARCATADAAARHPYRLLVRAGLGLGFALVLLRTVIVPSPAAAVAGFSGGFFVLCQINRHGCVFTVSLNSAIFCPTGARSRIVEFSFSVES